MRGVLIFEVLLNATSMFKSWERSHPGPVRPVSSMVMVTPDMHRVHHSIVVGNQQQFRLQLAMVGSLSEPIAISPLPVMRG